MKHLIINPIFALLAILLPYYANAQCGFLVTKVDGTKELMSGDEFDISVNSSGDDGTATIGDQNLNLSEISNIEPYPRHIVNGDSNSWQLCMEKGMEFIGCWNGGNHTQGTKTSPHPGVWTFLNDGTFSWESTAITGQNMNGEWRYDDVTNMIYTNSNRCPVLTIISAMADMIVLKNETYNEFYTLTRREHDVKTLNQAHVIEFRPDGFVVRASFNEHRYINKSHYKLGISYALSTSPHVQKKVYVRDVEIFNMPPMGENWRGMADDIKNNSLFGDFGGLVSISGLSVGDKVILRSFAEFPDGTLIEGDALKVMVIRPPVNGIFLGMRPNDSGEVIYWYNKPVGVNGPITLGTNQYSPLINREDVTSAIDNLRNYEHGVHWDLPRNKDLFREVYCFRWYGSEHYNYNPSAHIGMYSPVNYACAPFTIGMGDVFCDQYLSGVVANVKVRMKLPLPHEDNKEVIGVEFVSSSSEPACGFLIPCLRYHVIWY